MRTFRSHLRGHLAKYVTLRRALGSAFVEQNGILLMFDRFLLKQSASARLSQSLVLKFATSNPAVSKGECWRRYHVVRHFFDYLSVYDPSIERLPVGAISNRIRRRKPYVYSENELAALFREAPRVLSNVPLHGQAMQAMMALAVSSGLRVGEIIRLNKADLDRRASVLLIRQSKFRKDRLVPLHASTALMLKRYEVARDRSFATGDADAFFLNTNGRRHTHGRINKSMRRLVEAAGLRAPKGVLPPSFHSFRHTFAVRRLIAWYEAGADVQSKLPALATYMGHANYKNTAYYLTATAELMAAAARRYHDALNAEERS